MCSMKRIISFLFILSFIVNFAAAQNSTAAQSSAAAQTIINNYAARNFLSVPVTQAEIDQIVQAAVRAPSARNRQPWHFTVIQNASLAKQIIPNTAEGNVIIVVSAPGDSKTNPVEILDAALATQSIYLAAQALGLGSRILTAPVDAINRNLKNALDLPSGYSAVAVVRIGKIEKVDAVSAASARKKPSEVVTYKK